MAFETVGSLPNGAACEKCLTADNAPSEVDVLVVGLGPVGAAIANLLGRYGVRTLVIEKAADILMAPRAIVLDNEALRILQLVGLKEDAFERVAIHQVRLLSPLLGEFGTVNSLGSIDGHPKLVTFYQPELEQALRSQLARYDCVKVLLGAKLTEFSEQQEGLVANIRIGTGPDVAVRARYMIGADGASSLVRQLIGQKFDGQTYAEDWLIVDARKTRHPIDHVEFICDHRRPTPHMIAPGGRERWEFKLQPGELREEMESETSIRKLLAPWGAPEDLDIERKAVYRFHARVADTFSKGRVFLAGDAAHITPPFVGQGLVAGLRDAANLSWKLAWVIRGQAAPYVLDSYDQERRPHAKSVINYARFMGKLVMPRNAAIALLTHGLMRLSRLVPPLRRQIEELGVKPKNVFSSGLFVKGRSQVKLVRGSVFPQGYVRGVDGCIQLSDDAIEAGFTLIGLGADPQPLLDLDLQLQFAAAGGRIVQIAHRGQRPQTGSERWWEDLLGIFLPGVARTGWAVVVRPDRTIVHDGPMAQVNRLVRESLDLIGVPRKPAEAIVAQANSSI